MSGRPKRVVTRFTTSVVFFKRPFILDGFGRVAPAGAYTLDIQEESADPSPTSGQEWRHLGTSIRIDLGGTIQNIAVDPSALIAALERDDAQPVNKSLDRMATSRRLTARKLNRFLGHRRNQ